MRAQGEAKQNTTEETKIVKALGWEPGDESSILVFATYSLCDAEQVTYAQIFNDALRDLDTQVSKSSRQVLKCQP